MANKYLFYNNGIEYNERKYVFFDRKDPVYITFNDFKNIVKQQNGKKIKGHLSRFTALRDIHLLNYNAFS